MELEFFVHMIPPTVTHHDKEIHAFMKAGHPHAVLHDSAELKNAKAKMHAYLAPYAPQVPMIGPIRLVVKWCFPRDDHRDGEYRISKPDTDNLEKMLKDTMTRLHFWKDDAQVCSEIAEKFWAENPGIYIHAEEIGKEFVS